MTKASGNKKNTNKRLTRLFYELNEPVPQHPVFIESSAGKHCPKRRVLILVLLFCSTVAAQSVTLTKSFPESSRLWLQALANDISRIVHELFHRQPPLDLPILCYVSSPLPITLLNNWSRPTGILIGITIKDTRYSQFAYQLAHELGHVMLDPRRSNGVTETICTALSYEVLDRLAKLWAVSPPFEYLKSYALQFTEQREKDQREHLSIFDPEVRSLVEQRQWSALSQYLRRHQTEMEPNDPNARDVQALAAIVLRSGPINWERLRGIATCTKPTPQEKPTFMILPLSPSCVERLGDGLCRIGIDCSR